MTMIFYMLSKKGSIYFFSLTYLEILVVARSNLNGKNGYRAVLKDSTFCRLLVEGQLCGGCEFNPPLQ